MKKLLFAAVAAAMLFCAPVSAQAEDQDMAKITCKEFLESKENISLLLMWIDGYMSAKSNNTVLSDSWMEKLGTHMGTYCGKNPTKTVMEAMEAMPE